MTNTNCLECGKELTDKFCSGCGQKADTHRITFKNFVYHDVLHGTFHIEKGMLFTAKQALLRPGKASLDYIAGKRKRYYNVFLLVLITIALLVFVRHVYKELLLMQGVKFFESTNKNAANLALNEMYLQRSKLLIFLFVPFVAINSFILFRKKKLNLSEHSIIAGMILLGTLLLSTFGHLFYYINLVIPFNDFFATAVDLSVIGLIFFYIGYGYFNAFGSDYSRAGITSRIVLLFTLIAVDMLILLIILIGIASNWTFAGTFDLNPLNPV